MCQYREGWRENQTEELQREKKVPLLRAGQSGEQLLPLLHAVWYGAWRIQAFARPCPQDGVKLFELTFVSHTLLLDHFHHRIDLAEVHFNMNLGDVGGRNNVHTR